MITRSATAVPLPPGRARRQGVDPGDELGHRERLHQVVVGALAQSVDPVGQRVPGRQHQHGGPAVAAQRGERFEAVPARQHHVQDHQVRAEAAKPAFEIDAALQPLDLESLGV